MINFFLAMTGIIIVICVFYFSPKKPKMLNFVKLKRKVLLSHGLRGFTYEKKEVLEHDYFFQMEGYFSDGWEFNGFFSREEKQGL